MKKSIDINDRREHLVCDGEPKGVHTPGPWTIKEPSSLGDYAIVVGDDIHAECYTAIRFAGERADDECLANANLIAASPAMYKALKHILDATARTPNGECCQVSDFSDARAAIDKAEGWT